MSPAGVPPKQARSAESQERILQATEELLKVRPFEELTLLDICTAADVSTSSLYARFRTKDQLLDALLDRYRQRIDTAVVVALDHAARSDGFTVGEAAHLFSTSLVDFARANDHLAVTLPANRATRRASLDLYEGVVTLALQVVPVVLGRDDGDLAPKVEFIVRSMGSIVFQGWGANVRFADRMGLDDGRFVVELSDMVLGYLAQHMDVPASELAARRVDPADLAVLSARLRRAGPGVRR